MGAGRFVLENEKGEVVRTFAVKGSELILIYRHDLRRVEVVSETQTLKDQGVSFDVLKKTSASAVRSRSVSLANGGRFKFTESIDRTANLVVIPEDSEEQEKVIYKYTAMTQVGAMLVILIIGLLIEPFFTKKELEAVIVEVPQQFIQPPPVQPTVKPSEKIVQRKRYAQKAVQAPTKPVSKTLTARTKSPRKENAPLRTKIKVENVGALGALGGMKTGSKNSSGFNMNALNDSRGTSWNGAGEGGVGGMERAVRGKGLVASASGQGQRVEGGGGYGTRGQAGGGRPGYGSMNMGGTAAAYFEPISEEALVEGGLTMDQIAAVINRHMGEMLYCYEKGLQVNPKLSGRVDLRWVINAQGRVTSANIASSSLGSIQVESCGLGRLRNWRFPKPVGGVNVKVQYPFSFKRAGQG